MGWMNVTTSPDDNPAHVLSYMHIFLEDWNSSSYRGALNAVILFFMHSFCEKLFSYYTTCTESYFQQLSLVETIESGTKRRGDGR